MLKRKLGKNGPLMPALGLGCMGMSNANDDERCQRVLNKALDLGVRLFDTADVYGHGHNEILVGNSLHPRYDEAFISTKFGIVVTDEGTIAGSCGTPEYVKESAERSLQRLNADAIDLYFIHRTDPDTPIEDTMEALAELVNVGKIRHIGLSEASANTIRRAAKVHPLTAVESEYSIFTRDVEKEILPVCREVGAAFIAYSPLGRGMLTGAMAKPGADDTRTIISERFNGDNLEKNLALVNRIKAVADKHGATASQIALAWVLAQGEDIFAIFGTTREENLQGNLKAMDIQLSQQELAELSSLSAEVRGNRYIVDISKGCSVETPERKSS